MKTLILATIAFMAITSAASATANCQRLDNSNNFRCDTPSGQAYNVNNAANAQAAAAAIAKQQQDQAQKQNQTQGQSQSSFNKNDNSSKNTVSNNIRFSDDSVSLATPAGGGCTWGVNVGVPGTGGAGVCGTTRNATAIAAAKVADEIGNPCLSENRLAAELLLRAPLFKGMKLSCGKH